VAFSPDGSRLASWSNETVRLWDSRTGQALAELKGHRRGVHLVAFSPDGAQLASSAWSDTTVRLWDARTGLSLAELERHMGGISGMTFSLDGSRIFLKYGRDYRAWDAASGQPIPDPGPAPPLPPGQLLSATSPNGLLTAITGSSSALLSSTFVRFNDKSERYERYVRETLAEWAAATPAFHRERAAESEKAEDWFAAEFHLRRLAAAAPEDASLKRRLAAAEAQLPAGRAARWANRITASAGGPWAALTANIPENLLTYRTPRTNWVHGGSSFHHLRDTEWVERDSNGKDKAPFTETARTDEYVEIRRKHGNTFAYIRLYKDHCQFKVEGQQFRRLYAGQWT
jgi:hypothetical protein